MKPAVAPARGPMQAVVAAIRRLCARGEDRIYEVDVIMPCEAEEASEVRQAFRACLDRGWIEPSMTEQGAFVPRIP